MNNSHKLSASPRHVSIDRVLLNERVGKAVRFHRTAKNKTVQELATAAGTTGNTISKIESGDYPSSLHNIASIARALGVTMNELVPLG